MSKYRELFDLLDEAHELCGELAQQSRRDPDRYYAARFHLKGIKDILRNKFKADRTRNQRKWVRRGYSPHGPEDNLARYKPKHRR